MFFKRKPKVDLDTQFKELYKEVNKLTADAGNELDYDIKYFLPGQHKDADTYAYEHGR